MSTPVKNILQSNLARLVMVNLLSFLALAVTFAVVLGTFSSLRQLFQVEVNQKVSMAAKSFTIGKTFVLLESEIRTMLNAYLHSPERIVIGSNNLLTRLDAIILEAKTSENFLGQSQGVDALQKYRQSLTLLMDDEVRISKNAMALELKNERFLQAIAEIEALIGQRIMEEMASGIPATGLLQLNAMIPFCREQILNAKLLIDRAIYEQDRSILITNSGETGDPNLAAVISKLQETIATMTSASPTITVQLNSILVEIPAYRETVDDLAAALDSVYKHHQESTRNRNEMLKILSQVDQQTVAILQKVGDTSDEILSGTTRTVYSAIGLILLVSVAGGVLVNLIGRQLASSARTAETARAALHAQVVRLDEEMAGRILAEREVRQLNENLEKGIKQRTLELATANDELESFVAAMSHDLRTPLRGIAGFSHALREEYGERLDAQGRAYLDRVEEACLRVGTTIDSILELSRLSRCPLTVAAVDLSAEVDSVLAELKRNEPDRQVRTAITPCPIVRADPRLMRALLEPLLANAWKFTRYTEKASIEFASRVQDGRVIFSITDNGAGFNMAYGNKLFQPFQRLHSPDQFPGLGIGLAMAKRIVQRYHGEIWAEGREGQGVVVSFYLAVLEAPPV